MALLSSAVAKLVNAPHLGCGGLDVVGSSPSSRILYFVSQLTPSSRPRLEEQKWSAFPSAHCAEASLACEAPKDLQGEPIGIAHQPGIHGINGGIAMQEHCIADRIISTAMMRMCHALSMRNALRKNAML